jgi:phage terminase Nu1 subunit (DNA packaging protein)
MTGRPLPVDPERLRRQFPELTPEDLDVYETVTRRILAEPSADRRARLTRDTLARGRQAREKQAAGGALTTDEARDLRYLQAVTKMQASTVKR